MSLDEKLKQAAIEVSGDNTIIDVANFQPKGVAGATFAGALAGGVAGGAVSDGNASAQAAGTQFSQIPLSATGRQVADVLPLATSNDLPQL